jgi:hypothetical protein
MKQHIDDRPGTFKSGGRRIDDHSFWAGAPGKDSRFPDGPHKTKTESTADVAGSVAMYEDTTEKIREQQMMGEKKVKSHPHKPLTRN